jgi:hypothetical protein
VQLVAGEEKAVDSAECQPRSKTGDHHAAHAHGFSSGIVGSPNFYPSRRIAHSRPNQFEVFEPIDAANTVTASQINKSDLFAVADFYPYPVDLANNKFTFIPGVFAGVAMNSQPLHSLIFGGSVGLKLVQVYAGSLLIKQQQLNGLSPGSSATGTQVAAATSYVYKPSFTIGIKISVKGAAAAISGSKK